MASVVMKILVLSKCILSILVHQCCSCHCRNEEDIANSGGKRKRKKREHDDNGFNSDDEVDRDDDAESFSMIESPMSAASPNATNDGNFSCFSMFSKLLESAQFKH